MATPSKADDHLDVAVELTGDAHAATVELQHSLHALMCNARDVWELSVKIEGLLAGEDGDGPLALSLRAIREDPAIRRARRALVREAVAA